MIVIIDSEGRRLCHDNKFRKFASYGNTRACVKLYSQERWARRTAKKHRALVARVPELEGARVSMTDEGMVRTDRTSPATRESVYITKFAVADFTENHKENHER